MDFFSINNNGKLVEKNKIPKDVQRIYLHLNLSIRDISCLNESLHSNVTILDLSHNKIIDISYLTKLPASLEVLDLSFNFIEDISVFATEFSKTIRTILPNTLTKLALNNNNIKRIDGLQHLHLINPNLNTLLLQNNELTSINKMSKLPDKLKYLNLDGNKLGENIEPLYEPNVLKYLSMESTGSIDNTVKRLYLSSDLNYLNLENNKITNVELLAQNIPINLSYLYLSGNELDGISPFYSITMPRSLCILTFSFSPNDVDNILELLNSNNNIKYIGDIATDNSLKFTKISKILQNRIEMSNYLNKHRELEKMSLKPREPVPNDKFNATVTPMFTINGKDTSSYEFAPFFSGYFVIKIKKAIEPGYYRDANVFVYDNDYQCDKKWYSSVSDVEIDELNKQQYALFNYLQNMQNNPKVIKMLNKEKKDIENYFNTSLYDLTKIVDSFASLYLRIILNENYPKSKLKSRNKPRISQLLSFEKGPLRDVGNGSDKISDGVFLLCETTPDNLYVSNCIITEMYSYFCIRIDLHDVGERGLLLNSYDWKIKYNIYIYENDFVYPKGSTSVMKKEIDNYNEQQYILFEIFREIEANKIPNRAVDRISPQYTEELSQYIGLKKNFKIPDWLVNLINSFVRLYVRMMVKLNASKCPLILREITSDEEHILHRMSYYNFGSFQVGYKITVPITVSNLRYFIINITEFVAGDDDDHINLIVYVYQSEFSYEIDNGESVETEREEVDKLNILQYKLFNVIAHRYIDIKFKRYSAKYLFECMCLYVIQYCKVLKVEIYKEVKDLLTSQLKNYPSPSEKIDNFE
jgi:Leucine-rich repeat (LRR) protein